MRILANFVSVLKISLQIPQNFAIYRFRNILNNISRNFGLFDELWTNSSQIFRCLWRIFRLDTLRLWIEAKIATVHCRLSQAQCSVLFLCPKDCSVHKHPFIILVTHCCRLSASSGITYAFMDCSSPVPFMDCSSPCSESSAKASAPSQIARFSQLSSSTAKRIVLCFAPSI